MISCWIANIHVLASAEIACRAGCTFPASSTVVGPSFAVISAANRVPGTVHLAVRDARIGVITASVLANVDVRANRVESHANGDVHIIDVPSCAINLVTVRVAMLRVRNASPADIHALVFVGSVVRRSVGSATERRSLKFSLELKMKMTLASSSWKTVHTSLKWTALTTGWTWRRKRMQQTTSR